MKKKLYLVRLTCDGFSNSFVRVGETEQEVGKIVSKMYEYDYIEDLNMEEIDNIDGYSIILKKKSNLS